MRTKSNFKENTSANLAPWRLKAVKPMTNYILEVEFNDGVKGLVDMATLIKSKTAGVFAVLKNQTIFNQVYLNYGVATWPGEIDLAPDAMHEQIKHHGKWIIASK